ncbi:hypothetical protein TNCV_1232471 [Trichonephila clavipes]|nr:hypothetical protein TNCV_1232471 [Trichonephila clavipes]
MAVKMPTKSVIHRCHIALQRGVSLWAAVAEVPQSGWLWDELEPCRGTRPVKSVESSNALPLVWCDS